MAQVHYLRSIYSDALPRICQARQCLNNVVNPYGYCVTHLEEKRKAKKGKGVAAKIKEQPIVYGEINVYFIQAKNGGPIKIGKTKSKGAKTRFSAIQTSNHEELVLLASVNCREWMEKELHALFEKDLVRGEWFTPTPRLLEIIECAKKGIDQVILNLRNEYTI